MEAKLKALKNQKESGQMQTDLSRIEAYAKRQKYFFLPEVIRDLNISEKTASGRLSDLEDSGILHKECRLNTRYGGKYSVFRYVSDPIKQKEYAHTRKLKKFNTWLKKASYFKDMIDETTFNLLTKTKNNEN